MEKKGLLIIGGGLAGCEAAWQAAQRGIKVTLYEMRPDVRTGAHQTSDLAELVCSNSLGSVQKDRGTGLLINELIKLDSLLIKIALDTRVPAGSALAVDRQLFSEKITNELTKHKNIHLVRREIKKIPEGVSIVASGPLTSPNLANAIQNLTGSDNLFFYDAIAPIVSGENLEKNKIFRASRYGRGEDDSGDYLNCPFTKEEYSAFVKALVSAERISLKDFEGDISAGVKAGKGLFFERCLPVEVIASRGEKALAYGPMRPVGLTDPRTGRWPYAVVQLRQEDLLENAFNLVGFQTNLTYSEQERVFRMIPGLENARFERHGQMHRNTFLNSPGILSTSLQMIDHPNLFFAGQIIGVEGYAGNIASGLLAGVNASRYILGEPLLIMPEESMLGSMLKYISTADPNHFQPMKANFGILPKLDTAKRIPKRQRYEKLAERALNVIERMAGEIIPG